jgi:septum site-determining protein MinC
MIEETPSVRIKGVGSSLWVTIAPEASFELVKAELTRLFEPLKHLAASARVVVDTGAGAENEARYDQVGAFLKHAFNPKEILPPKDNGRNEEKRFEMRDPSSIISQRGGDSLVIAGRVRSGQSVHAKKHLIVMGDVNPGCDLIAGGDILVFGSLCGMAAAGQPDNLDAVILALDFRPTQIKIGSVVAAGLPAKGDGIPEIAHIEDGGIVVDDYSANSPFKRVLWPVIR